MSPPGVPLAGQGMRDAGSLAGASSATHSAIIDPFADGFADTGGLCDPFEQTQILIAPSSVPSPKRALADQILESKQEFHQHMHRRIEEIVREKCGPSFKDTSEEFLLKTKHTIRKIETKQRDTLETAIARGQERSKYGLHTSQSASTLKRPGSAPPTGRRTRTPSPRSSRTIRKDREALRDFHRMLDRVAERPLLMEEPPRRDFYTLLAVSPSASAEKIQANFLALHEEETNMGNTRQVRRLEQAYTHLCDPIKRRQYDDSNAIFRQSAPAKSALWDSLEAEFNEKAEKKKHVAKQQERVQRQTIREICQRGAQKSKLVGIHKVEGNYAMTLDELAQEKRLKHEQDSKAQRAHIRDLKVRGASRERHAHTKFNQKPPQLKPSLAEEQRQRRQQHLEAEIAKRVAQKKAEALSSERSTKHMIREICARGRAQAPVANQVISVRKEAAEIAAEQAAEEKLLQAEIVSTSTSKDRTASDRWRAPSVVCTMTVENAKYDKLMSNEPLRDAFLATTKRAIAYEAGSEIHPEHVAVSLSKGSIIIHSAISTPVGVSAQTICTRLSSAPLFCKRIGTYLSALEGIDQITTGPLQITDASIITSGPDDSSCGSSVIGEDGAEKIQERPSRPLPRNRPLSAPAKRAAMDAESRAQWAIVQHIRDNFSQMIEDDEEAG